MSTCKTPVISIRVEDTLYSRLDGLSEKTGRTKTFYILKAVNLYLDNMEKVYLEQQTIADEKFIKEAINQQVVL